MKHLTYDDRLQIQKALTLNEPFSVIAERIGKNRTTISREIQAYAKESGKRARSKCKHTCYLEKKIYDAESAHQEYRKKLRLTESLSNSLIDD